MAVFELVELAVIELTVTVENSDNSASLAFPVEVLIDMLLAAAEIA